MTSNNICKIADVGRTQVIEEECYVSNVKMIVSSCIAPEALLYMKYSVASDLWSYGCVLYEIWSMAQIPFKGMANETIIEDIEKGYRPPPPPGCPLMIYYIMIKCWYVFISSIFLV